MSIKFMTFTRRFSELVIVVSVFALLIYGCSDQRTISQLPPTHPDFWLNSDSPDFHGTVALVNGITSCAVCHGDELDGGKVGVSCIDCHLSSGVCTSCHGGLNSDNGAPPHGLHDETDDTSLAVGAHTTHLSGTARSAIVDCESCHLVPASLLEPSHLDIGTGTLDSIAEITWQGIADGDGAAWNRMTRTCTNTYCHGNFEGGYDSNAPIWTNQGQAECGSCHDDGTNPVDLGTVHQIHLIPGSPVCTDCHSSVVDSFLVFADPSLHVNGIVDVSILDQQSCEKCHGPDPSACTYCHGGVDNQTGAPPRGLRGETSASTLAVGAHTTHLEGAWVSNGFACSECHLVPSNLTDSEHWAIDSVAEMTWGNLAGSNSSWDRATHECSNVYCHGNFSGGYTTNAPNWTAPAQAVCGSCHDDGSNPNDLSGRHFKHIVEENLDCSECHSATVDAGLTIIDKAIHVNGVKNVAFGTRQINYQNGTCSGSGLCHESKNWYEQ